MSEVQSSPSFVPEWDLADRMRKALRHGQIGVTEMAEYLDVGRNTVSTWINGRVVPSTQTMRLFAMRCGVPFGWLRDGEVTGPDGGGAQGTPSSAWIYAMPSSDGTVVPLFPSYHSDEVEAA